jgi:hypothetical protein
MSSSTRVTIEHDDSGVGLDGDVPAAGCTDGEHFVTGYIKGTAAISRSSDPIERVM